MTPQPGGCLCGALRYEVTAPPVRVTFCHCRFCQRATGAPYFMEPIFEEEAFTFTAGTPRLYEHRSEGSGKMILAHFCETCGTKLVYTFERFPGLLGIFGGTFDDPDWIKWDGENAKHIFLQTALAGTVLPSGVPTYIRHATTNDGVPEEATIFDHPHPVALGGNS
ncbi:GFA family protein [Histidinibacterium aquaticum]|uniref:GFA family protein n=1 Tax=Histidinibacterium aquaticum TaxID=2613962 RepID=A0A5J5GSZ1_9RHOB|nr:GFA family protein [Histidinibacterium aquaticum]KAA9010492.1 GFA family protein [Histidinibacterium aquaticum]